MSGASQTELVVTAAEMTELAAHLRDAGRFAFDTEFVSEDTFEPVLGLIQVATRERLALIDPLAVRDLTPFWNVVTHPDSEVVMHAAGEDLRICLLQSGGLPARMIDVQIAAGFAGFGYALSLGNLLSQALGVSVLGGETRTDWRRRPLTEGQIRYALDDVRHLLRLAERLGDILAGSGRLAWAEDEYRASLSVVRDRPEQERWRRLPSVNTLNRRGLEIARRLFEWRQTEAKRVNRPARHVLRDDLILALAKREPATRGELESVRDFNRPHLIAKSQELLRVVDDARKVAPEDLPRHPPRHDDGPGLSMVVNLLSATLNRCCSQARIATALVGTASDLRDLVRWHLAGQPSGRRPRLLEGWRSEVCGQVLLDVLSGKRALRIVDPLADVPIELDSIAAPSSDST